MISNISRQFSKIVGLNTQLNNYQKVFNNNVCLSGLLVNNIKFTFSTEVNQPTENQQVKPKSPRRQKRVVQKEQSFSPIDYYRNTIRKVNIRSNGKGKFTPYNFQKIINMAKTQEHAKVMFQAYFNYMGHFTLIPNNVVDTLVFKSITIGNQVQQVMQIFANHNYLAYFPHYDATNRWIKHLIKLEDQQNLEKMFRILIRSPLIKIDSKTVDIVTEHLNNENCQPTTKQYILKVLLMRRKLVNNVNQQDLLNKIGQALNKSEVGPFEAKPMIRDVLNQLLSQNSTSTEDLVNRLIVASTFQMIDQSGALLVKQGQEIGAQHERLFDYLLALHKRSSQQKNYGTMLKQILSQTKLSISVLQKLENLVNSSAQ